MHKTYDLKLGYSCNNHCIHCVIEDSKQNLIAKNKPIDILTQEALSLLKVELAHGIDSVTITGGEATIRRDLPTILDFCFERSLKVTLQTNGRLLTKDNIRQMLLNNTGVTLVIALHGTTSQIHDSITRVPGSYCETLEGIRFAVSNKIPVIIKTVISTINMDDLPLFIPFMISEHLSDINVAFPHAQGAARTNFELVVPKYSILRPHIFNLATMAKNLGINLTFETIPFCILPEFPDMMSELIYRCKNVQCTQVNEETFDWNVIRKQIKAKMPCCAECFFDEYCEGPWREYVDAFGVSEFTPVKVQDS